MPDCLSHVPVPGSGLCSDPVFVLEADDVPLREHAGSLRALRTSKCHSGGKCPRSL